MIEDIITYAACLAQRGQEIEQIEIKTFVPNPTNEDYQNGFIVRNFVQKANDKNAPIFEINENIISIIQTDALHSIKSIKWRIKGSPQEIMDSNKKSIDTASDVIPNLKLYLPNLLQFAKVN